MDGHTSRTDRETHLKFLQRKQTSILSSNMEKPTTSGVRVLEKKSSRGRKRHHSWFDTSRAYRKAHPVCEVCLRRSSTQCHHLTPLAEDDSKSNQLSWIGLQSVCDECHDIIHSRNHEKNEIRFLSV